MVNKQLNNGKGEGVMMKLLELFDIPGIWALWRTRPGAGTGAPSIGSQPPKAEAGIKANLFNLGQNDEALAIHAILRVLTEKGSVTPLEREAFLDIITNHLTSAECSVFQKTLGINEQERSFSETTIEKDTKGKDVKKEKVRKETRNYRGEEIVAGLCKLAAVDKKGTIALMKKMGVTRTTGDVIEETFQALQSLLKEHDLLDTGAIAASLKGTSKKLEFFMKIVFLPIFLWAILLTVFSSIHYGSYVATSFVIVYIAFAWWRSHKAGQRNKVSSLTSNSGE